MTYLLDANVLSETRKREPAAGVTGWIMATPPGRLHVSVLTLGEIEQGIARFAAGETGAKLPPWNAGSGMWRPGSKIGFSRSPTAVAAAGGRQQYAQPLPVLDALIPQRRRCTA